MATRTAPPPAAPAAGTSPQVHARLAGALFLVILVLGPFSILYVPSELVVAGDAAATADNVRASEGLLRAAVLSDAVILLAEIGMTVLLYALLRRVSRTLSLAAAFARLAQTVVMGVNLVLYLAVLLLVSGAGYLAAFAPDHLDALVLLGFDTHSYGVYVGQAFFGLHLVLLGYLVRRAGYFPRVLGTLLMIAGAGYLLDSFGNFLFPDAEDALGALVGVTSVVGELPFFFWLLVKGVDLSRWQEYGGGDVPQPRASEATLTRGPQ